MFKTMQEIYYFQWPKKNAPAVTANNKSSCEQFNRESNIGPKLYNAIN